MLEKGIIIEKETVAVTIDRPVVNIDDPFEIELAEWLLARENTASKKVIESI